MMKLRRRTVAAEPEPPIDEKPSLGAPPPHIPEPQGARRLSDRFAFLRAESPAAIYAGIACVAAGFVLIGITWAKVAALLEVSLQLPYLVSGGLTGLGLIMIGATSISVAVKRRDAAARARQLDQLTAAMGELRAVLRGEDAEP